MASCLVLAFGVGPVALSTSHSDSTTVKAVRTQETGWPVANPEEAAYNGV
jgi:hypothetical protein